MTNNFPLQQRNESEVVKTEKRHAEVVSRFDPKDNMRKVFSRFDPKTTCAKCFSEFTQNTTSTEESVRAHRKPQEIRDR